MGGLPSRCAVALAILLVVSASPASAQPRARGTPRPDTAHASAAHRELRAALDSFIVDFNNLDSARFSARWAREASAVLPFPDTPHRLDTREAVLGRLMQYFTQMRAERRGPPYLFMVVQDVAIDLLSERSAVVSYEFAAAGTVQRRSLAMVREDDGAWRVAHLHGSAAAPAAPAEGTTGNASLAPANRESGGALSAPTSPARRRRGWS